MKTQGKIHGGDDLPGKPTNKVCFDAACWPTCNCTLPVLEAFISQEVLDLDVHTYSLILEDGCKIANYVDHTKNESIL